MDGREHLIIGFLFFIIIWIFIPIIRITDIIIAIFISICPDVDLKFPKRLGHRSVWTHSIILPLILFIFQPMTMTVLFIVSFGLHCACDLRFKRIGGKYTIKIIKLGHTIGLDYDGSTVWLLGNFLFSLLILIGWCLI